MGNWISVMEHFFKLLGNDYLDFWGDAGDMDQ